MPYFYFGNIQAMTMSLGFWAIVVATFMYLLVGISCIRQNDYIHAGLWFSYSAANLFMLAWEVKKLQ